MADMIRSVGEGIKDVGKAVSVDAVKGVGQVAKDVVSGSVESLTGATVATNSQAQQVGGQESPGASSDPQAFDKWKQRKEQAARSRLAALQAELKSVVERKKQEEVKEEKAEEQEKVEERQVEESERAKRKNEIITQASRRGGTSEVKKGKF